MRKIALYATMALALTLLWQCDKVKDWSDPKDSTPPAPVSNIRVENTNGGAKIIYTRPSDRDLLGVKAVYTLHEGEEPREIFSSAYTDTIILEGYGDTNERTVEIFAVDKSNNVSTGVTATIKPLMSPIQMIRGTLEALESFGGIYVFWKNELKKDITISLYTVDEHGDYVLKESHFSKESDGAYGFKGIEAREQKFRIELSDRWGNYASNMDTILTPMVRENIYGREIVDGATVVYWTQYGYNSGADTTYKYRGDMGPTVNPESTHGFYLVYNDHLFGDGSNVYWQPIMSVTDYFNDGDANVPWPFYVTIDMGRKAAYSDMRFWMRNRSPLFTASIMSVFDIWATNNPKALTEIGDKSANLRYWTSWDRVGGTDAWKSDWVKIGSCRLVLPSGITKSSDSGRLTDEDRVYIQSGFPFDMDPRIGNQAFRYLRFEVHETNTGTRGWLEICELRFWGAIEH